MTVTRTSITRPSSWDFGAHPDQHREETGSSSGAKIAETETPPALQAEFPSALDNTPLVFGKYKGKTPVQIAVFDPYYLLWCEGKDIVTGSVALLEWCKRVADRVPQNSGPKGKLITYGRR